MIRALRSFPANKSSMTTTTTEIHSINFHLDCRCCVFPLITAESQQLPLLNLLQRNLPGDFKQSLADQDLSYKRNFLFECCSPFFNMYFEPGTNIKMRDAMWSQAYTRLRKPF